MQSCASATGLFERNKSIYKMLISHLLAEGREALGNSLESEILLAFLLKKNREYLIAHCDAVVDPGVVSRFSKICKKRAEGVPISYLTNFKEFYGLGFYVDERVLIPRPETEMLVEEAIKKALEVHRTGEKISLCDVGTGSGCIAIVIANNVPKAEITAVDISEGALEVAKKNAKIHRMDGRIEFLKSDLMAKIRDRKFNGIVANLPYIGRGKNDFVAKEVLEHEPNEALFGGETGLELFDKFFAQVAKMKHKPHWIVGEMGFSQQKGMLRLIKKYFIGAKVYFRNDLAGLPRMFVVDLI